MSGIIFVVLDIFVIIRSIELINCVAKNKNAILRTLNLKQNEMETNKTNFHHLVLYEGEQKRNYNCKPSITISQYSTFYIGHIIDTFARIMNAYMNFRNILICLDILIYNTYTVHS